MPEAKHKGRISKLFIAILFVRNIDISSMDPWLWNHERLLNKMLMEKCKNESGWHLKSWWTLVSQKEGKNQILHLPDVIQQEINNIPSPYTNPKHTLVIIKSQPWICAGLSALATSVYGNNTTYSVNSVWANTGMEWACYVTLQKYNQQNPECGQFLSSLKTLVLQQAERGKWKTKRNRELFSLKET